MVLIGINLWGKYLNRRQKHPKVRRDQEMPLLVKDKRLGNWMLSGVRKNLGKRHEANEVKGSCPKMSNNFISRMFGDHLKLYSKIILGQIIKIENENDRDSLGD